MDAISAYRQQLTDTLSRAFTENEEALKKGARLLCEANLNGHNIFAFGCSHAMLPMLELYYRTGGMATINPVRAPGLCLDIDPATMTSQMERMTDYGKIIVDALPLSEGDVMLVHSVSGRNAVPIDVALRAKEKGASVVVITSMSTTKSAASRHPKGIRLCDTADVLIDNCGCIGDASVEIPGLGEKAGPTSTSVGAALLNAMVVQALSDLSEKGIVVPVFRSSNIDGGDEYNRRMIEQYKSHIFYM